MIVGGQTEARAQLSSTIIDYHEPFDQGLTVETAVIHLFILIVPIATGKFSRIRSNIIWNRWRSTLRARSI